MFLTSTLFILSSCIGYEDEKFNPAQLTIESQDLIPKGYDEYEMSPERGIFIVYCIDRKNFPFELNYIEEVGTEYQPESDSWFAYGNSYTCNWGKIAKLYS